MHRVRRCVDTAFAYGDSRRRAHRILGEQGFISQIRSYIGQFVRKHAVVDEHLIADRWMA
jgi:hypothetical protein